MLIKHNVNNASIEVDNLKNDIQNLEETKRNSLQTLKNIDTQLAKDVIQQATARKNIEKKQSILASKSNEVNSIAKQIETLKSTIKSIKVVKNDDLITIKQKNVENYLLGLKVEGKKIALLVDSSASMTNEKLIDIIKTKSSSNKNKQQAKKWLRTKRIVKWLLARLPKNSVVIVVAFNEKAKILGKKGWSKANDPSSFPAILTDLNALVPKGATNLHHGLKTINKFSPSNLYIITDGLPTKGESRYKNLNPFSSCSSLLGNSNIISGACRVKLFRQTINESAPKNTQVDVILLPLEGDPDAINQYWYWAASTGGLVLSPANKWP